MYTLEATQGKVIVEKFKKEDKVTDGGVIYELESSGADLFSRGKVLSIGEPFWDGPTVLPLNYQEGDTVIFGEYAGKVIEEDEMTGSQVVILSMMDIQAKVRV